MAIYPGATYRPITVKKNRKRLAYNRVGCHVAVSEARSLFGAFNRPGKEDSHFYVLKDGSCEQYVDTLFEAFADLDGNDGTISIETQGGMGNANAEPWTAAQLETIAQIYIWAHRVHGIQLKLATSSHLGEASKGLSWHRLGCDGNFPALPNPLAGRNQRGGGMRYTKHFGKICPGDQKILQIPGILNRALQLAGAPVPAPKPPVASPTPVAPSKPSEGATAPQTGQLVVDGLLGPATIRRWQQVMGTPVDGVISTGKGGSSLVRAVQENLNRYQGAGLKVDGFGIYPNTPTGNKGNTETVKAMQRWFNKIGGNLMVDGRLDKPSETVRILQRQLNKGTF